MATSTKPSATGRDVQPKGEHRGQAGTEKPRMGEQNGRFFWTFVTDTEKPEDFQDRANAVEAERQAVNFGWQPTGAGKLDRTEDRSKEDTDGRRARKTGFNLVYSVPVKPNTREAGAHEMAMPDPQTGSTKTEKPEPLHNNLQEK